MLLSTLTFVPLWRLVKEEHDAFCVIYLKLLLNRLVFLHKSKLGSGTRGKRCTKVPIGSVITYIR